MPFKKNKKDSAHQKIALEHVNVLFNEAEIRKNFAVRYISLAKQITRKCRIHLPLLLKRKVCKKCSRLLTPDILRVRTKNKMVRRTCLSCGVTTRIPSVRERKKKL